MSSHQLVQRIFWLGVLALVIACGTATTHEEADVVWTADSVAATDIPGTGPSDAVWLERPVAATRLQSGVIVVADADAASLAFFDRHGSLIRRVGGKGGGPGEFRALAWLAQCRPDSLFAWDPVQLRITVFDTTGTPVRSERVRPAYKIACDRTGEIASVGSFLHQTVARGDSQWTAADVSLIAPATADTAPIVRIPLFRAWPPPPLGPATTVAITSTRLYVGTPDTATVTAYSLNGKREDTLSVAAPRRPATDRQFQAAIQEFLDEYAPPGMRASVRQQVAQTIRKPDLLPAYQAIFADPAGRLWAETSFPGDSVTTLRRAGGARSGPTELVVPRPLAVLEVGRDYVLGSYVSMDGDPHVAAYTFNHSNR